MKSQINKAGILFIPLLLFFSLSGFAQVTITPSLTPACSGPNGAVTFTLTGGTSGYTYILTNIYRQYTYPGQTSATFNNLYAGTYQVYAYNGQDSGFLQFNLPSVVSLQTSTTNATCSQHNGNAFATVTGGTGPYTYNWISTGYSTLGNNDSLENRPSGSYHLAVSDHNGCQSDTQLVIISATSPDSVSIHSNSSVCAPTLQAFLFYGPGPYNYAWNTGETTSSINALFSGRYIVTVTDNSGCSASDTIQVSVTPLVIDSLNTQFTYPNCSNSNTGSIAVHMTHGTAPYSFIWSGSNVTDSILTGLPSGSYSLTVSDANGCAATRSFYLYTNNLDAYIYNVNNPTCTDSDGSLMVVAYHNYTGSGTFRYAWSYGNSTDSVVGNLPAGNYTVTVSDGTGCTAVVGATLTGVGNFQYTIATTPTSCNTSLPTGTATAIVTGTGTAPYNFTWYSGWGGSTYAGNTQTISNLPYGTNVSVSVTDANGCIPTTNYYDSTVIQYDPSCYDNITGYVFADTNSNCLFDAGEQGLSAVYVLAQDQNGQYFYASPDSTGFYNLTVLPGIYTVGVSLNTYSSCTATSCTSSYKDTFTTTGQVSSSNNFGLGVGGNFDLGVHLGYQGSAPGQERKYWVYYYNWGATAVANGVLTFVHDPAISLDSTIPAYTSYNSGTKTITWDIVNNLAPQQWLNIQHNVVLYFSIPSTLPLGTLLSASATITPTSGDCDPSNNSEYALDSVSASHDPNSKEVSPAGNLTATDTALTYTIRFQNTGNAPATLVVIKDTLSPNVDPATVVPGASSSKYKFSLSGNGILTFTFEPISLPDSSHDPAGSNGFVMYTVHTKKNLPLGSQIDNTAYIYFDANPAVVTNTTSSLRSNYPTGISNITNSKMTAQVVPNPVHGQSLIEFSGATGTINLLITDELGNIITSNSAVSKSYTLNAETLTPGIYFYTAKDAVGNKATGKISVVR